MQSSLGSLRVHLDVLVSTQSASGKKSRGGKTERLKAVTAVKHALSRKTVVNALSAVSVLEMVKGPRQEENGTEGLLGWCEVASILTEALDQACSDALASKSSSRSGNVTMKSEYMLCFRAMLKLALARGPSGVLRPLVPAILYLAHQWLSEPTLRAIMADQIWQCVRDILQDDANRAMLTPPFIRTWIDVCVEQLTGRGPLKYSSSVVSNLAGDVLQIIARGVENYDILTQSTKSTAPSKMLGGDFGYAFICERCCLMLVIAESFPRREAREVQAAAFRTLSIAFEGHALDVLGSNALKSVIYSCLKPLGACWTDRPYRDSAVALARILLLMAPTHKRLRDVCRTKLMADMRGDGSLAVVRAGVDVRDDFVDVAAGSFSIRECLHFASSSETAQGHIIIWLRVAHAIFSRRVLKKGTSFLLDRSDLQDQCGSAAEAVHAVILRLDKIRESFHSDILMWTTRVLEVSALIVSRMCTDVKQLSPTAIEPWQKLYLILHEQLAKANYSGRSFVSEEAMDEKNLQPYDFLLRSLSFLCSSDLIESCTIDISLSSGNRGDLPYPFSRIIAGGDVPTALEVDYLRNVLGRSGLGKNVGEGHYRIQLVHSLIDLCQNNAAMDSCSATKMIDVSCIVVGLTRGVCGSKQVRHGLAVSNDKWHSGSTLHWLHAFNHFRSYFGNATSEEKIIGEGNCLADEVKAQDTVWSATSSREVVHSFTGTELNTNALPNTEMNGVYIRSRTVRHVDVDLQMSESLERQIENKLRAMVDSASLLRNTSKEASAREDVPLVDKQSTAALPSANGFPNETAYTEGSKILLFLGTYLLEGFSRGFFSIPTTRATLVRSPCENMVALFIELLRCFGSSKIELMLSQFDLTVHVTLISSKLCRHFLVTQHLDNDNEVRNDSPHHVARELRTAIADLSNGLCRYLMHALMVQTKATLRKVQQLSRDELVDSGSDACVLGKRTKKHLQDENKRAKRSRQLSFSSDRSDEDASPGGRNIQANDFGPASGSASEGSDSDNDFPDPFFERSPIQSQGTQRNGPAVSKNSPSSVEKIAKLVRLCVEELPALRDSVFDACLQGFKKMESIERMLSPDGFERPSLACSLLDPHFVDCRKALWNMLYSLDTSAAVEIALKDILKVGMYWKELEAIAQSYVTAYVESMPLVGHSRKAYPLPDALENLRISFLENGTLFLERCLHSDSSSLMNVEESGCPLRPHGFQHLLASLIDISEHFRVNHAFRMPRQTRISYLKFGLSAIEVVNRQGFRRNSRQGDALEQPSSLEKGFKAIQSALCKFLADSEAVVRIVAATLAPRLFATFSRPIARIETLVQDCLPQNGTCQDSSTFYGGRTRSASDKEVDESTIDMQFNLMDEEHDVYWHIYNSFRRVGARSKSFTTFAALEAIASQCEELLPFCVVEIFLRVAKRSGTLPSAYQALVRLSASRGYSSPRQLFLSFARILMPKWFDAPNGLSQLYDFPVALVVDSGHENETLLFDWMRDQQSVVIPHVLVRDTTPSLEQTTKFADVLGSDLRTLLTNNVGSFSLVYPMHYVGGWHEKACRLWRAVDAALVGCSAHLLLDKKAEVIRAFLGSSSCGSHQLDIKTSRTAADLTEPGFFRDTREVRPPMYDPLVIALAMNKLFDSDTQALVLPRNVLRGSLFSEVRDAQSGLLLAESFNGFLEECQRSKISLLRVLLTISRSMHGPPYPPPSQNQTDSFFCVGLLWRMLGINLLVKSSSERLLFYRLVVKGFERSETVSDAAWLLQEVQKKVVTMDKDCPDISLSLSDLCPGPTNREHLRSMNTSRERQMYELLNAVSPNLVDISSKGAQQYAKDSRDIAITALVKLLQTCHDNGLWTVILTNGPFPKVSQLAEATKLYEYARSVVEVVNASSNSEYVLSSLAKFQGLYRSRKGTQAAAALLACLQELRFLMTDSVSEDLSRRFEREAWLKSDGQNGPTTPQVESSIACLINLIYESCSRISRENSRSVAVLSRSRSDPSRCERGEDTAILTDIVREAGFVLGVLGLLNRKFTTFIPTGAHHKRIPALRGHSRYENAESGIKKSFFLLMDMLHGPSPINADSALDSLVDLLRTDDGRMVYKKERQSGLEVVTPFKDAARKPPVTGGLHSRKVAATDPLTGEEVQTDCFPDFLDPQLWNISKRFKGEIAPHEQWLRRFCCVLARKCNSTGLQSLAPACYVSYRFSCELLPYLLMDIIPRLNGDTLCEVSVLMRQHVLDNRTIPVDILRTFLHALDVLSQIGLQVHFTKGIGSWVHKDNQKRITPRPRYVLEISYAEVARAALRSGSYFSVLRFSQMHVDRKVMERELSVSSKATGSRGDRRQSSCPARDPSIEEVETLAREEVTDLVREALTQINESDGARAFGYSESVAGSTARLAAVDKDWLKCLSALDAMAGASDGGNESDKYESSHIDLFRECSLMTSFMGLGTLSIASNYWSGLHRRVARTGIRQLDFITEGDSLAINKLNDFRYAISWKLGHWESPALLPTPQAFEPGKLTSGFHEAIYEVLHAYKTERFFDAAEICAAAQLNELKTLVGDSSGVAAKSLFQSAARLHVFRLLEVSPSEYPRLATHHLPSLLPSCPTDSVSMRTGVRSHIVPRSGSLDPATMSSSYADLPEVHPVGLADRILGQFFEVHEPEFNDGHESPSRYAFDNAILTDDLPIAMIRCLNMKPQVTRAATTVSARVLFAGGSGAWARAVCCLGTKASACFSEASEVDRVAWKLQEARLRWTASDDALSRKRALSAVKDIISKDLGGSTSSTSPDAAPGASGNTQALAWESKNSCEEKYAVLRSEACRMAANWSLDMRTHEPMDLFETLLESGLTAVTSSDRSNGLVGRAHFHMATFADAQLASIDAYRKTQKYDQMVSAVREVEEKIENLQAMKQERHRKPKTLKRRGSRSNRSESGGVSEDQIGRDLDLFIRSEQKKASQDRSRLEKLNEAYQKWQLLACRHFAASLRHGSAHDLIGAFRMVGLWLDSGQMRDAISIALVTESKNNLSISVARNIDVPVTKLLPLAPQLSSRLSFTGSAVFQKTLSRTIQSMAEKFPAHCLWQLLALSNSTRVSGTHERYASLYRGDKDKKDAADHILDRLQSQHGETVQEMKKVADAYISLSETRESLKHQAHLDMKSTALMKLGEVKNVPVPTVPLPLNGRDAVHPLPTISTFEKKATVCSGLSKPLKVVCHGSDGKRYPQIVKGKDDLRGDAVMEQLFTILNSLLERDTQASQRSLLVRTYRIVPLSPFSGIMQFVSNTQQFKDLLVERGKLEGSHTTRKSLHERYRPYDMKHEVIQSKAFELKSRPQLPKRLHLLRQVWPNFQPVFRFFFLEQWLDPAEWFAHQLAYSRSVAVMSIVGFILGLGDRHLSNILLDVFTGEVVHIDFGIAFEQGKLLPTPELMPFRLTRDIVDGFGIAGVEGVFRKSSEVTLSVMRRNKDVLLTVVEVLLHDPMFNWALTPEEVLREQLASSKNEADIFESDLSRSLDESAADEVARKVNKDINGSAEAQRALNRISEKLDGLEGTERLSVEAHVARLVDEAQAFHVVAAVYPGWAPWL